MGLFRQRPEEEEKQWAGLPSEPRDVGAADLLEEAPTVDALLIGQGNPTTSIVFPVAPPAPEAADAGSAEPKD